MVGNVVTSHYRGQLSHYRATFSGISGGRPPERDESLSPLSENLTSAEVPEEVPARKRRISNKTPCSAGGTVADIIMCRFACKWPEQHSWLSSRTVRGPSRSWVLPHANTSLSSFFSSSSLDAEQFSQISAAGQLWAHMEK